MFSGAQSRRSLPRLGRRPGRSRREPTLLVVDRRGRDGLVCRDGIRADVRIVFLVRVNPTEEDVLQVARVLGCSRAASREALDQMFCAKFTEAVKSAAKRLEFEELCADREQFKDHVLEVIGRGRVGGSALVGLVEAEDLLDRHAEHAGDPERELERGRVARLLGGDDRLAADADAVGELLLGHLAGEEAQLADPVADRRGSRARRTAGPGHGQPRR